MREYVSRKKQTTTGFSIPSLKHPTRGFGLESSAISRQAVPKIQPLNQLVTHDISHIPLRSQAKLSISQPGDIYEQEADSVAQQVMQRMAQPVNRQSIQREALPEDDEELQMKSLDNSTLQREALPEEEEELQMKSLDSSTLQREALPEDEEELQMKSLDNSTLQREALPEDEEELQMKSLDNSTLQREALPEDEEELQMKPMMQRQTEAEIAAAPDLEASINQAKSGGQSMADNIRKPMEQAFGADFSGVKVHTDGKSDQLNQSIQARAFTTGQDVFFRQGEYNPGSRGGQELLAHELTHVVQQNGGAVQRKAMPKEYLQAKSTLRSGEAIAELRDFQEMANNSPQTKQAPQLQAMADNYSDRQPIQKKESLTEPTTSLTTALSSEYVLQRKIKIKADKGKKTKTYANFKAFEKSPSYETLMGSLAELDVDPKVVEFHLKQLFSTEVEFENEQHFTEALIYDIQHKSMPDREHTLQEQYMTLYGWKKREAGNQPAKATGADEGEVETLKVYRTMKLEDWKELEGGNNAKLSGHLGDFKQAQNYLYRKSPEPKVLIEFTLRPGAERDLFNTGIMAFPDVKGKTVPNLIKSTLIQEGTSDSFAKASTNEGTAPDKVGIKSEGGEAGFSLGIGGGTSPEVFMGLVADKKVIGRSEAE
ncbi:eCIS core domain-containing protein [Nostoc sp.]|uniref:eCIS core domain-containing protein n=1 Tax=Nostoc sp. TaxID=1180 RepID=UPI002FF93D67